MKAIASYSNEETDIPTASIGRIEESTQIADTRNLPEASTEELSTQIISKTSEETPEDIIEESTEDKLA